MSVDYFDFVLCRHKDCDKNYLFRAPAFSHLEKGDMVIVDTDHGDQPAVVVSSITLSNDAEREIDFVMNATNAPIEIKRVLSKVIVNQIDFKYEGESYEESGSDS